MWREFLIPDFSNKLKALILMRFAFKEETFKPIDTGTVLHTYMVTGGARAPEEKPRLCSEYPL